MKLQLKNPIIFFDTEATGLDIAKDRIVEIYLLKIYPDGREESRVHRLNPTIPISEEARAIHGISNKDVVGYPTFATIAKDLAAYMEGCDLAGYNAIRFDIPLLVEEFIRAGVTVDFRRRKLIDVMSIFYKMEPRNLAAAYKFYCQKELENAHGAEADTRASYEVLQSQLDRYDNLQNDVAYLASCSNYNKKMLDYAGRFVLNDKDEPIITFGKHKGKSVASVLRDEPAYYTWIMNSDFPLDTKRVLTELRLQQLDHRTNAF
ncbi:MAG: 3'-5' exonuclease [Prevotellaceae bacterium]|jgi:DNA polymerase-3 subunit epsilon|nr:3'-5' exonuclease [Prevotellaceae bacterium]